jgi:hypothetical protein
VNHASLAQVRLDGLEVDVGYEVAYGMAATERNDEPFVRVIAGHEASNVCLGKAISRPY